MRDKVKTPKSWRRTVTTLLITILVVILAFVVWVNVYYNAQLARQIQNMNSDALSRWVTYTEMRLNTVYEHSRDLARTVYNNSDAKLDSPPLSFPNVGTIQTAFSDKLSISGDADAFFVIDRKSEWFLFSASPTLGTSNILGVKKYIPQLEELLEESHVGQRWYVFHTETASYFTTGILVGRYIVGTACKLDKFDILDSYTIVGDSCSCLLVIDEEASCLGGEQDWSEELLLEEGDKYSFPDSRTCLTEPFSPLGGTALLGIQPDPYSATGGNLAAFVLLLVSLLCLGLILLLISYLRKKVLKPTNSLLVAQDELGSGNIDFRLTAEAGSSEFETLFSSFNNMADQIQNLRIESYDRLLKIRENQLQMVRAQIKPHFFLNAITTVYNMTYQNRPEDTRAFLQALAKYVRYMMNIQSSSVAIAEELLHIENYLKMQDLRFPHSVTYTIHCPDDVGRVEIPFLMLFTLVENTFKHAMDLYKPLQLSISCEFWEEEGFSGCRLVVEDNGDGFSPQVLEEYQKELPEGQLPPKEHLGLSNIRHTLEFTYHRQDLLRLSNREAGGARAEILVPIEEEEP